MDPENRPKEDEMGPVRSGGRSGDEALPDWAERQPRDLSWILVGDDGLRAGWSVAIFVGLYYALIAVLDAVALGVYPQLARDGLSPVNVLIGQCLPFLAILAATLFMARVEHRSLWDYNLSGSHRVRHFGAGFMTGFATLSGLVIAMAIGGWLQFGRVALNGAQALKYGCIWGAAFLLVGFCEEGVFRCYLQATLTRGINFLWALAAVSGVCLLLLAKSNAQGASGVYTVALLGVAPCWLLRRTRGAGFWQAAWVTSTAFGFLHTGNNGETWVGVFAASLIGFIFCVSVWLTGSAWWAIGCHMAWDWTETFFYGTADSGFVSQGHLLTAKARGDVLWSGGSDGPEGSLLVIPAMLFLLAVLAALYRRGRPSALARQRAEPLAG